MHWHSFDQVVALIPPYLFVVSLFLPFFRMIQLFLSTRIFPDKMDDESHGQLMSILTELEKIIWTLMTLEGRSEARLWLCETIATISSLSPKEQRDLFLGLLSSKSKGHSLAAQLWQLIFEKRPQMPGAVLAKNSHMLEKFFEGHPKRILQWFANFSVSGDSEHRKGAKALSHFAFVNRDICWEELEWKGKHGQSPAVVATKPHYFLDLDVQRTVENLLDNVPEFWSSKEFAESLKDGEILHIDTKFFVELFLDLMHREHVEGIWEVVNKFLMEESFAYLCDHLLIILDETALHAFLHKIHDLIRKKELNFNSPTYWLEIILSKWSDNVTLGQILLVNALFTKGRQILRLLRNEEAKEEMERVKDLAFQFCMVSGDFHSVVPVRMESSEAKILDLIKWMGLMAWILLFRMSEESHTQQSWESLFLSNGLGFRKSDKYNMLKHDGISEDSGSDLDDRSVTRVKRKRARKVRNKKKRSSDDELLDFDESRNRFSLQSQTGSWLLSTDGYSSSWSLMDLPEYLSRHCLSTWIKRMLSEMKDSTST